MFCKNCGKEIVDGTKFCNHCGASQEAVAPQPTVTNNAAPNPAPKKNSTLKIGIIAAVAVVCFAIGSFVIAPSLSKDNDESKPTNNVSQSQNDDTNNETASNDEKGNTDNSDKKNLKAIDGGYNKGKMFLSDLGEYGKVSLSVGYNPENGVIRQVSAAFTITVRHSEYASMKSDFEAWEERISNSDDKNVEASYVELSESVSFIIGISKLNEADRAERVALAEEILDFVADEEDTAFYVDDLTTLLVDTYGFEAQD